MMLEMPALQFAVAPMVGSQPAANNKVEVRELTFHYGLVRALHRVNLQIPECRVTAIIGPSGCGKSTFIKAINRIAEVTDAVRIEGDVLLDGASVYSRSIKLVDLRRRVGMVFQRPNPFPKSIYDNIAYGPRLHGIRERRLLDAIVEQSLQQAALWEEVKDRLASSAMDLSGGQQQRLCIARTLAVQPEAILMDEPCSALDPTATGKIEELILELKKDYTIVIVTHNMQQAARVSDQTAFFLNGELVEVSETAQMFTKPVQKVTENYITGRFG
jgi:phosphate transport system ATP-binding protein